MALKHLAGWMGKAIVRGVKQKAQEAVSQQAGRMFEGSSSGSENPQAPSGTSDGDPGGASAGTPTSTADKPE